MVVAEEFGDLNNGLKKEGFRDLGIWGFCLYANL